MDVNKINRELENKNPREVIQWALAIAKRPVLTTNFGPFSASIIKAVIDLKPSIKVIWIDTGYNTPQTYRHANEMIDRFNLNIQVYVPAQTAAHRDSVLGIPSFDDPKHSLFTRQVKLEPFQRAFADHQPDVWFTNLRKGQTTFRDGIDIVSLNSEGIIKVSPFYNWSDTQIERYLDQHNLPNERKYYDPTKQLANRECGLHI
ncbi:MAG: phosphoadenosine phosphosulfate reductase family protein [Bacteroidota bacterium]